MLIANQVSRILALLSSLLLLVSCGEKSESSESTLENHEEAVAKFQNAQKDFKRIIATVKDEKSFDAAKPGLDQIITEWGETTSLLKKLSPPSEEDQERFQKQISAGHKATEPTGVDMYSLIMIEERSAEIEHWLEEFAQAGQEVGLELLRLYGETDCSVEASESLDLDFDLPSLETPKPKGDEITIAGVPLINWPNSDSQKAENEPIKDSKTTNKK